MLKFEMTVVPARYPTSTMSKLVEEVLRAMNPEHDWNAWVEQKNDRTLTVSIMSVG